MTDMAKPQPAYTKLNPTPRSMKNNGKYRRSSKTAYGDPIVGTDHGSGRSATGVTWLSAGQIFPYIEPESKPIPYAGIRTGEITGHRAWLVVNMPDTGVIQLLCSLAHRCIWTSSYMGGKIDQQVGSVLSLWSPLYGGVYAYATPEKIREDMKDSIEYCRLYTSKLPKPHCFGIMEITRPVILLGMAIGTLSMWGEVVEHEYGYRSEHARIKSLDEAHGLADLDELRKRYEIH